ncbi:MAG TPA: PDR/VanB family oxidoreductase, partial [Ramlibacter sp.]|nr:PDR/VanB family oxidoreductase [Ramlibacter sp.]
AEGVLAFDLRPADGGVWPEFSAGAHIDLHLRAGKVRSYSLVNPPGQTHRYVVAVHLDANGRGGSRHLHQVARAGDLIKIAGPRNTFGLREEAPHSVLIAGGIGVTPLWNMAQRLEQLGAPWTLHYCARSREAAAYVADLEQLAAATGGALHLHFDGGDPQRRADLSAIVGSSPAGAHLYCCGPAAMLRAFDAATSILDPACVHREFFAAPAAPAGASPAAQDAFTLKLARSCRKLAVGADQTVLEAVLAAGVDVPYSCMSGICRACETRVLDGRPDHRDMVLDAAEQSRGDTMIICCSRALSAELTLDL